MQKAGTGCFKAKSSASKASTNQTHFHGNAQRKCSFLSLRDLDIREEGKRKDRGGGKDEKRKEGGKNIRLAD